MKHILLILIIAFTSLSCKAQTPIIDINNRTIELVDNAYLKDVNNELDKFVGIWLFSNSTSTLKIVFQKKINIYNGSQYEDLLVGEYQYLENNIEIVNTLANLNNLSDLYDHNLIGNFIIYKNEFPGCSNCNSNEKRIKIDFSFPNLNYLSEMYMGLRYIQTTIPSMQIDFSKKGASIIPNGAQQEPSLPFGRYTLIKQ